MILNEKTTLIKHISQILCLLRIQSLSAFQRERLGRLIILFLVNCRRHYK